MGQDRIDAEESGAWGKGIDYFEYAKALVHTEACYISCDVCKDRVREIDTDEIFGKSVCLSCYQRVRGDLDSWENEDDGS